MSQCDTGPGWPRDTFEQCATHDCVIVSGDECITSVEYNTFHVNFVVSLHASTGSSMNKHTGSSSSSLGSRCVLWLGEGLSMLSPNYHVLNIRAYIHFQENFHYELRK